MAFIRVFVGENEPFNLGLFVFFVVLTVTELVLAFCSPRRGLSDWILSTSLVARRAGSSRSPRGALPCPLGAWRTMRRNPSRSMTRGALIAALAVSSMLFGPVAFAQGPDLDYRFRLEPAPRLAVHVELTLRGAAGGISTFEVAESWGGVSAGGKDIEELTARDGAGNPLEVERLADHRWRVLHAPEAELRVAYVIRANEHQLEADPSVSRRPILNADLFHTVGNLGILREVELPLDEPLDVRLRWQGFEEHGWSVMTSFGPGGEERDVRATIGQLLGSLYVAGNLGVHEQDIQGYPLFVTIAGDQWGLDPEEFALVATEIVAAEREFFDDFEREFYWINLIPVGRPGGSSSNMGGTGLHNCFALFLHPDVAFDPGSGTGQGVLFLLAHETFHEWNGRIIRREQPEQLVYWFSEGFTNFYARRLLVRSGWVDAAAYAAELNRSLSTHHLSPVRTAPNQSIVDNFWRDRHHKDLPYHRGNAVALLVDQAIRQASAGERSLDDLMRELVTEGRDGKLVSTETLLAKIAQHADEATAERMRAIVVDGELPELPADLLAPCLELRMVEQPIFDLGFDFDASVRDNRVQGLREDSRAFEAGLRSGQKLTGWSVYRGQTDQPAVLTIEEAGGPRQITFLPHGETREVPTFVAVGGEEACANL